MPTDIVFRNIEKGGLLDAVSHMRSAAYRLVQISATATHRVDTSADGVYELNYSFARGYDLVNYRLLVPPGESVPSVSGAYPSAFLYENEMHDLFGIPVENMTVNYKGMFYKLAKRTPYAFPSGPRQGGE
jgi:ech hydrogenase subunit D